MNTKNLVQQLLKDLLTSHSEFFPSSLMLHLTELGYQTHRPVIFLCKLKISPLPGSPWSALKYLQPGKSYRGRPHQAWFWSLQPASIRAGSASSALSPVLTKFLPSILMAKATQKNTTAVEKSCTPPPLHVNYTWGQMIHPTKQDNMYKLSHNGLVLELVLCNWDPNWVISCFPQP